MANKRSHVSNPIDSVSIEVSEMLSKRYNINRLYAAIMLLLSVGIICSAVLTAEQVQQYHEDYMALQKMKVDYRNLQIENQRLVIEQQTFSATPQIASRAVTQLGMYSPSTADKLILQPMAASAGDHLNTDVNPATQNQNSQTQNNQNPSTQVTRNQGGEDE
ncbi:cell division protein FtsL [Psychrobacter sp. FDAARGOS_221]|uniref:cell division protein FtsL n=1 Tax=Psychrobacter sp. FDAARGOS_221 TaxID=1975705 RepID=UPI000BB54261|nr:cell division protein FtsL [Psychrobacter sp. FDAARGOS_221]PNK60607.1 cell division protein FtsL [Psychrobacter sp. FDAARGOS_221]